ncbi:MAG: hypothetical protein HRT69_04650 [Flavobacteriaceae bacterium]|nr:hypothetical protein [Flavobacteriaceae bacterium]
MKYLNKIMLTSLAVLALSSCNDDENANTTYTTSVKPVVSVTAQSATSIIEGDRILVTLETNTTYKEDMHFKLELDSGTGTNGDYFVGDADGAEFGATSLDDGFGASGYKITFPAYAESHSFYINATKDLLAEGSENIRFRLSSTDNGNGLLANGDNEYIDLEIENYSSDYLGIIVDWSSIVSFKTLNQYDVDPVTFEDITDADNVVVEHNDEDVCGLADIDFWLAGANAQRWTGDCPEEWTEHNGNLEVLADGTYELWSDLWAFDLPLTADDNEIMIGGFSFPVHVTIAKTGTFDTTFTIPSVYSTLDIASADGGDGSRMLATIEVAGGNYTVYDANGELVAAE